MILSAAAFAEQSQRVSPISQTTFRSSNATTTTTRQDANRGQHDLDDNGFSREEDLWFDGGSLHSSSAAIALSDDRHNVPTSVRFPDSLGRQAVDHRLAQDLPPPVPDQNTMKRTTMIPLIEYHHQKQGQQDGCNSRGLLENGFGACNVVTPSLNSNHHHPHPHHHHNHNHVAVVSPMQVKPPTGAAPVVTLPDHQHHPWRRTTDLVAEDEEEIGAAMGAESSCSTSLSAFLLSSGDLDDIRTSSAKVTWLSSECTTVAVDKLVRRQREGSARSAPRSAPSGDDCDNHHHHHAGRMRSTTTPGSSTMSSCSNYDTPDWFRCSTACTDSMAFKTTRGQAGPWPTATTSNSSGATATWAFGAAGGEGRDRRPCFYRWPLETCLDGRAAPEDRPTDRGPAGAIAVDFGSRKPAGRRPREDLGLTFAPSPFQQKIASDI